MREGREKERKKGKKEGGREGGREEGREGGKLLKMEVGKRKTEQWGVQSDQCTIYVCVIHHGVTPFNTPYI